MSATKISKNKLGPTGKFPKGKLCNNDKGEFSLAIGTNLESTRVLMDFGNEPITWIGFTKKEAIQIANSILEKAKTLKEE